MKRRGGTLNVYYRVTGSNLKGLPPVCSRWEDILERQNYQTAKRSGLRGREGRDKQSTDFQGAKTLPYAVCHYAFVKTQSTHNTGSKPCVHADFGRQCATVRSCTDVLSWRGSVVGKAVRVWSRGVWEVSVLSSQVCCDPKTALKPSWLILKSWSLTCTKNQGRT